MRQSRAAVYRAGEVHLSRRYSLIHSSQSVRPSTATPGDVGDPKGPIVSGHVQMLLCAPAAKASNYTSYPIPALFSCMTCFGQSKPAPPIALFTRAEARSVMNDAI